jgi:hypothetical protein
VRFNRKRLKGRTGEVDCRISLSTLYHVSKYQAVYTCTVSASVDSQFCKLLKWCNFLSFSAIQPLKMPFYLLLISHFVRLLCIFRLLLEVVHESVTSIVMVLLSPVFLTSIRELFEVSGIIFSCLILPSITFSCSGLCIHNLQ